VNFRLGGDPEKYLDPGSARLKKNFAEGSQRQIYKHTEKTKQNKKSGGALVPVKLTSQSPSQRL